MATTEAFILKGSSALLISLRALKSLFMLVNAVVMLVLFPFRGRTRISPSEKGRGVTGKELLEKQHDHSRKGAIVRVPAILMVPWKSGGGAAAAVMKVADHLVRRELAIRRVVEDSNRGDQSCVREYWLLGTKRGDIIFTQSWAPVSVKIRGLVILMHGLNEHSGRYDPFAKQLNANGYKVYGMDWVGLSYLDAHLWDKVNM